MHTTWLVRFSLVLLFPNSLNLVINRANIIQSQLKLKTPKKAHFSVLVWTGLARFALLTLCASCVSSCACLIGRITVAITKKMALSVKSCKFSNDRWKLRCLDAETASELETGFSHNHEIMKPQFRPDSLAAFLYVQGKAGWEHHLAALSQAAGWMWGRRRGKKRRGEGGITEGEMSLVETLRCEWDDGGFTSNVDPIRLCLSWALGLITPAIAC